MGNQFDAVILDESFNMNPDADIDWFLTSVLTRMKPGVKHQFWKPRVEYT